MKHFTGDFFEGLVERKNLWTAFIVGFLLIHFEETGFNLKHVYKLLR